MQQVQHLNLTFSPIPESSLIYSSLVISTSYVTWLIVNRCWLSAYVDGYASATYELLVTLQDTTVELGDAVPQFGSVRALGYQR